VKNTWRVCLNAFTLMSLNHSILTITTVLEYFYIHVFNIA
jgi:hypothetical protein